MKPDLVFSIPEIKEKEGLTFSQDYPVVELLEEGSEPSGACQVRLDFSIGGEDILLEGALSGKLKLPCSRCLVEHDQAFEARFEELYPIDGGTIDANEEVRQTLLVNVPDRSLCRPDCRGLCPRCGKNLNEGPCQCASPVENRGAVNAKPKT